MKRIQEREAMKSYILAAGLLPESLWRSAFQIPEEDRPWVEEFRLRQGRPMAVVTSGKQQEIPGTLVTKDDLEQVTAKATELSYHRYEEQVREGFITVRGGHRLGLCGRWSENDRGSVLTDVTSVNLRIARPLTGIAEELGAFLASRGAGESTLILSPPGVGKTTLLRDLCRVLSRSVRVCVADCRCELGGFDLGRCDVLRGGQKDRDIELLLRGMSPELIAVDEITSKRDAEAMLEASYTGVGFLATAHGEQIGDLTRRPLYRALTDSGLFRRVLLLSRQGRTRTCQLYERGNDDAEDAWCLDDHRFVLGAGAEPEPGDDGASARTAGTDQGAAGDQDRDPVSPRAAAGDRVAAGTRL